MKVRFAVILTAMALSTGASNGQTIVTDGNSLLRSIRLIQSVDGSQIKPDDMVLKLYGLGYLAGFLEGSWKTWTPYASFKLPPGHFSVDQLAAVVGKYLSDHPERLHEPAGVLILRALTASFPNSDPRARPLETPQP